MQVEIDNKIYETSYFPFFRMKKYSGYHVYGIRYPSGRIETLNVMNYSNYMFELKQYLEFLVTEYLLEDNDMLTPYALRLKKDIGELFDEAR